MGKAFATFEISVNSESEERNSRQAKCGENIY